MGGGGAPAFNRSRAQQTCSTKRPALPIPGEYRSEDCEQKMRAFRRDSLDQYLPGTGMERPFHLALKGMTA
jgi:hypothetical protein